MKRRGRSRSLRRLAASQNPRNRQGDCSILIHRKHRKAINSRLLRQIVEAIIICVFGEKECAISIALLDADEISRVNKAFLKHDGATDVITFDYSDGLLCAELLICVDEAIGQAQVFETTWQSELVRYLVHGFLHLDGYEDHVPVAGRRMKREEDRIVEQLARKFDFSKL